MSEWKEYRLGEVSTVQTGPFGSQLHQSDYKLIGTPIITVEHLGENKILHQDIPLVSNEDKERLNKYVLAEGDIVFSRVGSVDRRAYVSKNEDGWMFSGRCLRVRVNKEIVDPKYLSYYFGQESFKEHIRMIAVGATMPSINTEILSGVGLNLPDLPEQRSIASIFSSLDDKIDLLHRQNKTLEALAETLFRQWFKEEAEEGWVTGKFGDIADINPTYQLKKGDISPYLEMSNVSTSTFNPEGWYEREFSSGMKFKNGDTLIARITPCLENGKTCYVTFLDEEEIGWGSTEYIVIRMKKPFHPFISYIMAKDKDFRDFAVSSMSGSSGRQRAQADVIKEYDVIIPPLEIIKELNLQLAGITPKLEKNAKQIRTLTRLRDTLLPKLMSGEVRVAV